MSANNVTGAWLQDATGQRYEVPRTEEGASVLIGRVGPARASQQACINIPQSNQTLKVSREHAYLWPTGEGKWEIADARSRFGLVIDDLAAEPGRRYPLRDGTRLVLGDYRLTFRIGPADETAAEAAPAATETGAADGPAPSGPTDETLKPADFPEPPAAPPPADETPDGPCLDGFASGAVVSFPIPGGGREGEWILGRLKESAAPIGSEPGAVALPPTDEFQTVSRRHALLARNENGQWIVRNESKQGTIVNGRRLAGDDETALQPGDQLILGATVLYFRPGPPRPDYRAKQFDAVAVMSTLEAPTAGVLPDDMPTRELPASFLQAAAESDAAKAWGELVENTHIRPRRYTLANRVTRIGSHPLNCDVQMEDPGVSDVYAMLKWHGENLKIHSMDRESPVRVDHVAYRVSPPLTAGAILTLGNREFRLDVTGSPPEQLTFSLQRRLRRTLIFLVVSINVLFFGALFCLYAITPDPPEADVREPVSWDNVAASVIQYEGPAGLTALDRGLENGLARLEKKRAVAATIAEPIDREMAMGRIQTEIASISRIQREALPVLREISAAYDAIHKEADDEFRRRSDEIQAQLRQGKRIFDLVALSPDLAKEGWYREMERAFSDKRGEAFETKWERFIKAVAASDLDVARAELAGLENTGFEAARTRAALSLVGEWQTLIDQISRLDPQALPAACKRAQTEGRSRDFVETQKRRVGALRQQLGAILTDEGEAARALTRSERWKRYYTLAETTWNLLSLIEAYQLGDMGTFENLYAWLGGSLDDPLVEAMRDHLILWTAWRSRRERSKSPIADHALYRDILPVYQSAQELLDDDCPLLARIEAARQELRDRRLAYAVSLRADAEQIRQANEKIMILIEAYPFDPSRQAMEKLEKLTVLYLGRLHAMGAEAVTAELGFLCQIRREFERLISEGVMETDCAPKRQIASLLKSYGLECP